ncbi:MAG: AI-2E family transporter [Rhodothermales bacterium]|nr:AI-2E family transporter [Rhodothermales bacterium]
MPNSRLTQFLLGVVAIFVVGVILKELRVVLLPFVIAILLSNVFSPIVTWLRKRRVPTIFTLFLVLLSFSLVVFLMSLILVASVDSFVAELPKYEEILRSRMATGFADIQQPLLDLNLIDEKLDWRDFIPTVGSLTAAIGKGVGSILGIVSYVFLILLFMLFMLAESGDLTKRLYKAFPQERATQIAEVVANIDGQVQQYLLTKTLISMGTGIFTSIVLWLLGVDFALMWGFLAFLLNFIPNVGSIVATILPFFLSLLQFEAFTIPLLVLLFLGSVQVMMGNFIEPKVMSFSLNLSALVILLSLIFWGWLWGIWGMIIAVPITATLKIMCENIESLKPVAVLMTGRIGTGKETPKMQGLELPSVGESRKVG